MFRTATIVVLACWAVGCADIDVDATATVSEHIPTVATIEWDVATADAGGGFVEFGIADVAERRARAWIDPDGHARAVLLGMKSGSRYRYRIVEQARGERRESRKFDLTTGQLGGSLPELTVPIHDPDRAAGGYAITSLIGATAAAVIVDPDGEIVWAHQPKVDWDGVTILRVTHSQVGEWVVYNAAPREEGAAADALRTIVRVSLDGSREAYYPVPDSHHDFFEHADGTLAVLEYDHRTVDDESIRGDRIVEIAPDGSRRTVWSVWDHYEYDPAAFADAGTGWSHANALDYSRSHDAYFVSIRNFSAIAKVDRTTGAQVWTLGGPSSDFAAADGTTELFRHQHQFQIVDDAIVIFDNGVIENGDSRAVEYRLDPDTGLAEHRWEYHADPPLFCAILGDVHRLRSGNTLVTWSGQGQIDEVTPDGEVVWRARAGMGHGFGFTRWRKALFDVVRADLPVGALTWEDAEIAQP